MAVNDEMMFAFWSHECVESNDIGTLIAFLTTWSHRLEKGFVAITYCDEICCTVFGSAINDVQVLKFFVAWAWCFYLNISTFGDSL